MKRTEDDLAKIIESFGYTYSPVDETSKAGRVRYLAFANRVENGKVNDEVTAFFGYEDTLLNMEQEPLEKLIKTKIDEANQE